MKTRATSTTIWPTAMNTALILRWSILYRRLVNRLGFNGVREYVNGFFVRYGEVLSDAEGAFSKSIKLVSHGTSKFKKPVRRINLETTIKVMERQRGRLSKGWCQASNIDEHGNSLGAYAETIREFPNDSISQAKVMLAQPHTDRWTLTASKILDVVNAGLGRECN